MEAWLEKISRSLLRLEKQPLAKILEQALRQIPEGKRFMLLEGLIASMQNKNQPYSLNAGTAGDLDEVLMILLDYAQDVLLQYYGGLLLLQQGRFSEAQAWFEKCLILAPDFWLARLELLTLALQNNTLPQSVEAQLVFFLSRAKEVKRFICSHCGLKRESVFFVCPRCGSWHSISFRRNLNE
jgi:tetratricopeptide (TPR) repeat protein